MNFVNNKLNSLAIFKENENCTLNNCHFRFPGVQSKYAECIRLDSNTKMENVINHIYSKWKLTKPNLIISITGRRKNFFISNQIKRAFQKGLIESTKNINAWITTNGTNVGISKLVGETINSKKTKLFGILSWNTIAFRRDLEVFFFSNLLLLIFIIIFVLI